MIIDESVVSLLRFPLLDKRRNEIDARFISDDIAWNELARHSQTAEPELRRPLLVIIIAHVILAVVLHVMHIQAHIVSQSVRHEQTCHTCLHHVVQISPHDIQCTEFLQHQMHGFQMHLPVRDARPGQFESQFVTVAHNLIDVTLLRGELSIDRICPCEIRSVVHIVFRTGIYHHQPS